MDEVEVAGFRVMKLTRCTRREYLLTKFNLFGGPEVK
jgi:hypothetical protein